MLAESARLLREGKPGRAMEMYRTLLESSPDHPEAVHYLGVCLMMQGEIRQALALLERSVELAPRQALFWHNYGLALAQQGDCARGERALSAAVELDPRNSVMHNDLGAARQLLGRLEEAADAYRAALKLDANNAEAADNYGHCLTELGDPVAAVTWISRSLELKPKSPSAHNHLGAALRSQGDTTGAVASFRRAIELDPGNAQVWCSLGSALRSLGDFAASRAALHEAVRCAPDFTPAWQELALVLPKSRHTTWDAIAAQQLTDVLLHPAIDGGVVGQAAANMALLDPELAPLMASLESPDEPAVPAEQLAKVARPLLLALLENALVSSMALERFLRGVRRGVLGIWTGGRLGAHPELLPVICALAQQCFLNDYVYPETSEENANVERLAASARKGASAIEVALLAAYRPLARADVLARPKTNDPTFDRLWQRQVIEPAVEASLAKEIPAITPIRDAISIAVRRQYEENPYPRWYRAPAMLDRPFALQRLIATLFPHFDPGRLVSSESPDILIAGCGSGYNVIDVAGCRLGRVLAVDLSLTSLAHAIRGCRSLGLPNVSFAQADLLELGSLSQRFDIINCGGVLHHLRDPFAGWQVLTSLLKPGGVMKFSLYSEIAHREIVAAREFVARRGLKADLHGIRAAREAILALPEDDPVRWVVSISDFYSATGFRDMVMHVQESRFTASRLREYIDALGLELLGFDHLGDNVKRLYRERFPEDPTFTSLENWGRFEEAHPHTFSNMYQFWLFKPS